MNYSIRFIAINMFLTFPLMTQSMFLALAKRASFSRHSIVKRSFHNNMPILNSHYQLLHTISTPCFELIETKKIIAGLADRDMYVVYGTKNKLIEDIVFKATEHRKSEEKYASVLRQLREHGWTKSSYCKAVMLHSAVISDLPHVTQELLVHDSNWVHEKDLHGCVPIDYSRSSEITKMLKDAGSKDARPYYGEDLWYRVPDYGWQEATPLRKAVYNGDQKQCLRILSHYVDRYNEDGNTQSIQNETKILVALANLRFWRTQDEKYLEIRKHIERFYIDHSEWYAADSDPFWSSRLDFE